MDISQLQIDLFVLSSVVGGMILTVWLFRRFPMQSWFENRVAWLCPRDYVIANETLAQAYPYRYLFMMFFSFLGYFTLLIDLKLVFGFSIYTNSLVRYGASVCVAVFALYTSRMNARRRGRSGDR